MGRIVAGLVVVTWVAWMACGGQISFVGEGSNPDPNQEVTVYVQTDTPLWLMWVYVAVEGDATLTTNIDWEDCNDYGWDPGWSGEVDISQDGHYTNFGGLSSAGDANGVVGYFKFIYHGGQVTVSMTGDGITGGWAMVPVSTANLVFGQSEQNINTSNPGTGTSALDTGASSAVPGPRYSRYPGDGNSPHFTAVAPQGYSPPAWPPDTVNPLMASVSAMQQYAAMASDSWIIYDANTVLTENTVWQGNVVLCGSVTVEGCMLVIMPGTIVWNGPDISGVTVRDGGAVVANGSNDNRICFIPFPDNVYYSAITVESTASPASSITYCDVYLAYVGILMDSCRLEHPLEQISMACCYRGIRQEGPDLTDVFNNEMTDCAECGIEVFLADAVDPNSNCSADTHIAIEHNSVVGRWPDGAGQRCGIILHGSQDPNKVGYVAMADNLIAGSKGYAICLADGQIACEGKFNHGYYNNLWIDNNEELHGQPWNEIRPHITSVCPFVNGPYDPWPLWLVPDCNFVNGGAMTVEETGYLVGSPQTAMVCRM